MWVKVYRRVILDPCHRQGGIALLAVAGALLGLFFSPEKEVLATSSVQVMVRGHPVDVSTEPRAMATRLAKSFLSEKININANRERVEIQRSVLGARVDLDQLTSLLEQAQNPKSPLRRVHAQTIPDYPLNLPMPAELNTEQAIRVITALKDRVDYQPINARLDPAQQQLIPSKSGVRLDLYGTLETLDRALVDWEESVRASIQMVAPERTLNFYKNVDIRVLLSEFDTRYDRSNESRDRTHNLKRAASAIDGYVLRPDEVFDFNQVVGRRTKSNGFRDATVISDGQLADGKGGGTCQISSTLYAAVYLAGLPIVKRHPHSRPSYYIRLGLDAAVAYPALNFTFKNDLPFPIVLGVTVENGFVHAEIRGARHTRTVVFDRNIEAVFPYRQRIKEDPSLPTGVRVLTQRGVPGFRVARTRKIINAKTRKKVEEKTKDIYPATTEIWRVGTGPEVKEVFELPQNDTRPEYLVDEFLTLTWAPGMTELKVKRDPGITGRFGWTSREGFLETTESPTE